jgi:hypothetical protein
MALFAVPMLVDCGGQATCDDLCDNLLDKCASDFGEFGEYEDVVRNDCLEQCAQRSNAVPEKCALEKDDVLSCLADADSLDCSDAQQSASCANENAALNACVFGSSNDGGGGSGGGGGSTSSAPSGQSCENDGECASGICSWANDTCIVPGELGALCERDNECESNLCSWVDDTCSVPQPLGEACERDNECIDGLCNWSTDVCSELGASGAPCGRDNECLSNSCPNDTCQ